MGRPRGDTREKLVRGAFEALGTVGYAGASSRAIGRLAGVNPALVFYYFENVDDLLVTALAESSAARLERHREAVEGSRTTSELVAALGEIYRDDVDSGHLAAVSELVAASVSRPQLAGRVTALVGPWIALAEQAFGGVLAGSPLADVASARSIARAAVFFYLGANLLARLEPESDEVGRLLEDAERIAALVDGLAGTGA
jgi:AcrR family transcriptional regulator